MKTILQQKLLKKLFLAVLIFRSFVSFSQKDDYPWKNETYNTPNLIYGMYFKHCTDWVAWKINQNQDDKATTAPHAFWNSMYSTIGTTSECTPTSAKQRLSNACRWENVLENNGFFVTSTPTPGAIAQWNSNENGVSAEGHVAYVESVNIGEIPVLSHYNFDKNIRGIYKLTTNVSAPRYIRYNVFELTNTPSIQAIIQGNPFNMTATIKSNHSASVTVKIRAALYSISNQLLGVLEEKTVTFAAGQSKSLSFYKNNIESTAGDYKVWIETRVNDSTPFTLVHKFQASSTQSVVINEASANCKITLSRNLTIGGQVSGDGTFVCGSSKQIIATPNSGYAFVNWTENGTQVSTDNTYNFTLSKNRNLVANFVKSTTINIIGSINAVVYPTSVGNHNLRCNTEKNVSFTIKNISNAPVIRSFKLYITDMNGNEVGELWNVNNLSLTANETKTYDRFTVPNLGSKVATAAGKYKLVLKGDIGTVETISLNSPTVVCQTGFCNPQNIEIECPCKLTVNSNPTIGGAVSGSNGSLVCGSSQTVTATPNSGYAFVNWTENGIQVSTAATYNFTLSKDRNLVANFVKSTTINIIGSINAVVYPTSVGHHKLRCNTEKNVSFTIKNISNATVVRSYRLYITDMNDNEVGELWNADNLSLQANETKNYDRFNFPNLGLKVSTAQGKYKLVLKGDIGTVGTISLNSPSVVCQTGACNPQNIEIECPCKLTVSSNPAVGGSVSVSNGSLVCGISQTVTATPNTGYSFVNWTENGTQVSTDATYNFTLSKDRNLVANFTENQIASCSTCPSYDFEPPISTNWETNSSTIQTNGCKTYRFLAIPGNTYTFKTGCEDGANSNFDTVLELFDKDCNFLTLDNDFCQSASKIEWLCNYETENWVYVKVTGNQASLGDFTLAYSFSPDLSTKDAETQIDGLKVFPNPTKDIINITTNKIEINTISIINNLGRAIKMIKVNNSKYKLNIQDLPTSTYFLKVETKKATQTVKIIKE